MTRDEALNAAAACLAQAWAEQDARSPREAAEAAHRPGGPSIDELESRIRARRGLPPVSRSSDERGVA